MASQLLFIGTTELLLIGGIALLLFGGKKLPEMMKGLGQGVQSFKKGMNEPLAEVEEQDGEQEKTEEPEEEKVTETESKQPDATATDTGE